MKDILLKGINYGQKSDIDFVDLRFQNKYLAKYENQDGDFSSKTGSRRGISIRVLFKGCWGFSSTTALDFPNIKKTFDRALKLSKGAASTIKDEEKVKLAEVKSHQDTVVSPRVKPLGDIPIDEKIALVQDAAKVFKDYENIKTYQVSYDEIIEHKIIVNSEGTIIELQDMKPTLVATAVAAEGRKMAPYMEAWCKTKGYELVKEHPLKEIATFTAEQAMKNLEAKLPPGGPTKVVIDHTSVGIIAHEAIGHCSEADLVESGSFLKGKLDQKVCSEKITLIDAPVMDDASGWLPYDDEGTKAKKVEIIKEGVLKGYLTNREYAAKMGIAATGNARAYSFKDDPIVRMRNTYIAPGDMTEDELFEAVGDGIYVTGMMNGSADTSGEFMVGTGQGRKIENGKLTDQYFIGPTMTGNAFEMLSSTLGVGKKLKLNLGRGFCGKTQPAKVDAGGGKLAVEVILGGQ
ncbi:TldD/PmbA family protein [Candidatus Heimdallarchaeota archaeon]|nr:MAG: TldD/PmbA family protein [Candidatus Heimdallarchaeota archaeon]